MQNKKDRKRIGKDEKLNEIIKSIKENKYTIEDFIDIRDLGSGFLSRLSAIREIKTLSNIIKKPKDGKCYFIEGNKAWVSIEKANRTRIVRYFSGNEKEYFYMDITDFYEVVLETNNFSKVLENIFKDFNVRVKEEGFRMEQKQKYTKNLEFITKGYSSFQEYRNLWRIVRGKLWALERLNLIGMTYVQGWAETVNNESIFFSAYSEIANPSGHSLEIKSRASTVSLINLFCLLGLVEKVRDEDLPHHVLERAKKEVESRKVGSNNRTNIYLCKPLTERNLEKAESIAKKMRENKIQPSKIDYNNIEEHFGKEIADNIYGDTRRNTEKSIENRKEEKQTKEDIAKNIPF